MRSKYVQMFLFCSGEAALLKDALYKLRQNKPGQMFRFDLVAILRTKTYQCGALLDA